MGFIFCVSVNDEAAPEVSIFGAHALRMTGFAGRLGVA
jgi:hypothetical protein